MNPETCRQHDDNTKCVFNAIHVILFGSLICASDLSENSFKGQHRFFLTNCLTANVTNIFGKPFACGVNSRLLILPFTA